VSAPPPTTRERPAEVIWHEVECGRYRADLPLWRELAAAAAPRGGPARVLDLGAGIGRVTLDLAAAGHLVTAVDISPALLDELALRAGELPVRTAVSDIRELALEESSFDLCIVPMQTLQLLRGEDERRAMFEGAAAHIRTGALVACAIVTRVDTFDALEGQLGPSPDRMALGERSYFSRPLSVRLADDTIRIERERVVLPADRASRHRWRAEGERDVVELAIVTEQGLWREGAAAGLHPEPTRLIEETDEHAASEVVMLRA
jgi:SAM-dependent methyltransferase